MPIRKNPYSGKYYFYKVAPLNGKMSDGRDYAKVSFDDIKHLLERDDSFVMAKNCTAIYNDKEVYFCKTSDDANATRDYYYNREDKTVKIQDRDFIMDLLHKKYARYDLMDGKLFHNGIIYDGGEFAKQEMIKYENDKMTKRWVDFRKRVFDTHNHLIEKKVKEILGEQVVKITQEAKEKAHRISERMIEVSNGNNEIYIDAVNFVNKKDDPVIRDVYIADGQTATPATCGTMVSESQKLTKEKLLAENKYRVAWIHSHAKMSPFHSSMDDKTLRLLTFLFGRELEIKVSAWGYESKTELNIYPSLVFNARRSAPHIEIGTHYWSQEIPGTPGDSKKFSRGNVPLEVISESNGIDLSTQKIDREIIERVTWAGKDSSKSLEGRLDNNDKEKLERTISEYSEKPISVPVKKPLINDIKTEKKPVQDSLKLAKTEDYRHKNLFYRLGDFVASIFKKDF